MIQQWDWTKPLRTGILLRSEDKVGAIRRATPFLSCVHFIWRTKTKGQFGAVWCSLNDLSNRLGFFFPGFCFPICHRQIPFTKDNMSTLLKYKTTKTIYKAPFFLLLCSMHIKLPCLVTMKISKLGLNSWAHLFADGQGAADHAWCVASVLNRLLLQTDLCLDPTCHLLSV